MRIAVVTDDGEKVSRHFGRASYYMVFGVEDGAIVAREERLKQGGQGFCGQHEGNCEQGFRHGYGPGAEVRHSMMALGTMDCQVLIAGGMGWGAYEKMKELGINPIVTDVVPIEDAIRQYIAGTLCHLEKGVH
jgi:predicted Fe-Mo cluster-binding NifX family protein